MTRRSRRVTLALCCMLAACADNRSDVEPDRPPPFDERRAARIADELEQSLMRAVVAGRALAENARIRAFFDDGKYPHRTLTVLREAATRSRAEVASLLDGEGIVIASTDPETVGYDFSHWAFFEATMEGETLVLPAVGFVNERRGLFVTVPVSDGAGGARGAVVMRTGVGPLDRTLEDSEHPSVLAFRERYVLATNRPRWGFHGVRGLDQRGPAVDLDERGLLEMLDSVVPPIGAVLEHAGTIYDVRRVPLVLEDWQLLVCVARPG